MYFAVAAIIASGIFKEVLLRSSIVKSFIFLLISIITRSFSNSLIIFFSDEVNFLKLNNYNSLIKEMWIIFLFSSSLILWSPVNKYIAMFVSIR